MLFQKIKFQSQKKTKTNLFLPSRPKSKEMMSTAAQKNAAIEVYNAVRDSNPRRLAIAIAAAATKLPLPALVYVFNSALAFAVESGNTESLRVLLRWGTGRKINVVFNTQHVFSAVASRQLQCLRMVLAYWSGRECSSLLLLGRLLEACKSWREGAVLLLQHYKTRYRSSNPHLPVQPYRSLRSVPAIMLR